MGDLKNEIQNAAGVQICRQALKGWDPDKQREAQKSTSILKSLVLEKQTELILADLTAEGFLGDVK